MVGNVGPHPPYKELTEFIEEENPHMSGPAQVEPLLFKGQLDFWILTLQILFFYWEIFCGSSSFNLFQALWFGIHASLCSNPIFHFSFIFQASSTSHILSLKPRPFSVSLTRLCIYLPISMLSFFVRAVPFTWSSLYSKIYLSKILFLYSSLYDMLLFFSELLHLVMAFKKAYIKFWHFIFLLEYARDSWSLHILELERTVELH